MKAWYPLLYRDRADTTTWDLINTWNLLFQLSYRLFSKSSVRKTVARYFSNENETTIAEAHCLNKWLESSIYIFINKYFLLSINLLQVVLTFSAPLSNLFSYFSSTSFATLNFLKLWHSHYRNLSSYCDWKVC